ncbi:cytochrome P450 4C1-like [Trichoplusia ni]|uniref:Cytochrome P450 4C1-like n=1 Tax=Trichoplusia ni TaxID=7111 RepID=A0A7E5VNN2_TRINI|nr:cytochrome P450 4C1-like [Trichoplusia ni]
MLWLVVALVALLWWTYTRHSDRFKEVSSKIKCSIKAYPVLGHAYLFAMQDGTSRMRYFQMFGREAIKNGGLTNLWLGEKYYVVVVDPVDLDVIMKASLEKDEIMRFARNFIGNGIIFAPLPIWRPRRKILAPTFSPKNLNNFVKIFSQQSSVMADKLQDEEGKGPCSVWKYLNTYAMDSVCETALGVKVNAQKNTEEPFMKAFEETCRLIAMRMVQPWLYPNAVYRLLPYHANFEECKRIVCGFIDKIIKSKRKTIKEDAELKKGPNDINTFLELITEASGGDRGYSDEELQEETLVLVVAGTDTSAVGACFTICMLARHPDVQERACEELHEVFGDSDRPLTSEDLPRLKYLDAVVRETLRLYPPVPLIVRTVEKEIQLPSGVTLVPGCGVLVHIWGTHRNPQYWGDDADQFRPERFLETLKHPAAFIPFSYGPRNCLGYQYAMMSMKTAVATILRKYRISMPGSKQNGVNVADTPMTVSFDIMMKDVDRFTVQLEKRTK